jgi:hypothetical protein
MSWSDHDINHEAVDRCVAYKSPHRDYLVAFHSTD